MEHERGIAAEDVAKAREAARGESGRFVESGVAKKYTFSLTISRCLRGVRVYYSGNLDEAATERIRELAKREYDRALGGSAAFVEFCKAGSEAA